MPIVIISYIMAILFLVNLCNALSDFHGISDEASQHSDDESGTNPPTTLSYTSGCTQCSSQINELKEELVNVKQTQAAQDAHLKEALKEINTLQEFIEGMQVKVFPNTMQTSLPPIQTEHSQLTSLLHTVSADADIQPEPPIPAVPAANLLLQCFSPTNPLSPFLQPDLSPSPSLLPASLQQHVPSPPPIPFPTEAAAPVVPTDLVPDDSVLVTTSSTVPSTVPTVPGYVSPCIIQLFTDEHTDAEQSPATTTPPVIMVSAPGDASKLMEGTQVGHASDGKGVAGETSDNMDTT